MNCPEFMVCLIKLTLKAPITTKFVCFCCLLKCFRSLSNKQCRLRPDCSQEQSDLGPQCLSLNLTLLNNVSKKFAADDKCRQNFQMIFCWRFKGKDNLQGRKCSYPSLTLKSWIGYNLPIDCKWGCEIESKPSHM